MGGIPINRTGREWMGLRMNSLGADQLWVGRVVLVSMLVLIKWVHIADPPPVGRGLSKVPVSHDDEDKGELGSEEESDVDDVIRVMSE